MSRARRREACAVALLTGVALILRLAYAHSSRLPESTYRSAVIALSMMRDPWTALVTIVPTSVAIVFRSRTTWRRLAVPRAVRPMIVVFALMAAWPAVTASFDPYLQQGHALDRLLLLGLAVAIAFHPGFCAPFVALWWALLGAHRVPIGPWAFVDVLAPMQILIVFVAALVLSAVRLQGASRFLLVATSMHLAAYVGSAIAKVRLGWPAVEDPGLFFINAHVNGWRSDLDDGTVTSIARTLSRVRWPLTLSLLTVELSAIVVFVNRTAARVVLVALATMHVAITLVSGIFFWPWVVVDVALACVLRQPKRLFLSSVFVIAVTLCFRAAPILSWVDTRACNTYVFEAIGESGRVYQLSRRAFDPYDAFFTQGRFRFLDDERLSVDTYGETREPDVARALVSADEVPKVDARFGVDDYDDARARRFDALIVALVQRRRSARWWRALAPPPTTLGSTGVRLEEIAEPIRVVRVRGVRTFYDGARLIVLGDRIVREVRIP